MDLTVTDAHNYCTGWCQYLAIGVTVIVVLILLCYIMYIYGKKGNHQYLV